MPDVSFFFFFTVLGSPWEYAFIHSLTNLLPVGGGLSLATVLCLSQKQHPFNNRLENIERFSLPVIGLPGIITSFCETFSGKGNRYSVGMGNKQQNQVTMPSKST